MKIKVNWLLWLLHIQGVNSKYKRLSRETHKTTLKLGACK